MKIFILPVASQFQPTQQPFVYPRHNDDYYCIEQDLLAYLTQHPELHAESAAEADWHYLPIFWTRWHLLHDYATRGLDELQQEVDRVLLDDARTFTVTQFDGGPRVHLGSTVIFSGGGHAADDLYVPLLCKHHAPNAVTEKLYRASFSGRVDTHPVRLAMAQTLSAVPGVWFASGDLHERAFVELMQASHVALCPRGSSAASFRFYEAMQLGVVPLMIGDIDARPFKTAIDWSSCSLHAESVEQVEPLLDAMGDMRAMGVQASTVFHEHLDYQRWCPHVLEMLERRA